MDRLNPALRADLHASGNFSTEPFRHCPYFPELTLTVLKGIHQLWRMVRLPIKAEDFNDGFILLFGLYQSTGRCPGLERTEGKVRWFQIGCIPPPLENNRYLSEGSRGGVQLTRQECGRSESRTASGSAEASWLGF
jgi:hypothetical protein